MTDPSHTTAGRARLAWVQVAGQMRHVSEFQHLPAPDRPRALCPVCEEEVSLKARRHRSGVTPYAGHRPYSGCAAARGEEARRVNQRIEAERRPPAGPLPAPAAEVPLYQLESLARVLLIGRASAAPTVVDMDGIREARVRLTTGAAAHHVALRGALAGVAETWIRGGSMLYVEGTLEPREGGSVIRADEILLLDSPLDEGTRS